MTDATIPQWMTDNRNIQGRATGADLKTWREKKGLNQEQLAVGLGVAKTTIHTAEARKEGPIPRPLQKKLTTGKMTKVTVKFTCDLMEGE